MSANLALGKGKRDVILGMLRASLGEPCPYCGVVLTLENIGLDHKTPLAVKLPAQARRESGLDDPSNLHMVCRPCNTTKGDFTHEEFLVILGLSFADKVRRRLAASAFAWVSRRRGPKQ